MKRLLMAVAFLSSILLNGFTASAISTTPPPQLLEHAISLYPEKSGPFELHYRSDLRMHELGFEITTYTFLAAGSEAGYVTRVTSLMPRDADEYYDLLLRLDAKKRIAGSVNLAPPVTRGANAPSEAVATAPAGANIDAVLRFLHGKDAGTYKDVLTVLINGLASGANLQGVEPMPPPPKDLVLDTTGKILLPGAPLPLLKTRDLQGTPFSTESMKKKVIMVFTAPACGVCDGMIQALEKGLDLSRKRDTVDLVYVVGSEAAEARTYLSRLKARGRGVAEPDDSILTAFKAPFRPYILMFENGTMKYNFVWENDESKLFGFLYLLIEGTEPEGEDA